MFKAFKYRIFPTEPQKVLITKHIGSSRFVFNLALETKNAAYIGSKHNYSAFDLVKQLPELKKELPWLKEVNSQSLQQAIQNMDIAFKKFFKGAGFPKFKSKHKGKQSFSIPQNVKIENSLLVIPKFKDGIKMSLHRPTKGTIKSATISVTPTGKYFVSILCDTKEEIPTKAPIKESTTIGVDLGIKDFAITSEGEVFENPKHLRKAQSKLKYVQRKYSKYKGKRTKKKLAKLHEDIVNKRKDFLHKVSTQLIRENQTIAIETLAVKNMVKNHNLAQAISDASWSTFVSMLEYKADWCGKNIIRIGRFAPSSKTCSNCGNINKELTLKDREWTCSSCSTVLDRDVNAAINIKSFALKNHLSGEHTLKNQDELPRLRGVLTPEAQSIVSGVGRVVHTEDEILDYDLTCDSLEKNNVLSYGGNSIYSHNKIPEKIFKINKKYGGDNFSYDEYINQLEQVKNTNRMNIGNMNIEIQLAQYRLKEVLEEGDQEYIDDLKLVINKLESALNNCFNYDKIIDNIIKTICKIKNGKTI